MPLKNKKIVISGGPGSGKTTLIDLLNKNGFDCIEELSRGIIKMQEKKEKTISLHPNPLFLANKSGKEEGGNTKQQTQSLAIIKSPMYSLIEAYTM